MPAFSFQAQFIKAIETGEKSQTIRALRKDGGKPCHIGDTLYLYTEEDEVVPQVEGGDMHQCEADTPFRGEQGLDSLARL